MRKSTGWVPRILLMAVSLLLAAGCATTRIGASDTCFTFAVASDVHQQMGSWSNALIEIRDMQVNPAPAFPHVELFLAQGDFNEPTKHFTQFQALFEDNRHSAPTPIFLPAMGNHDTHRKAQLLDMIPKDAAVHRHDAESANYYYDYKNVRFIVLDVYFELGKDGMITQAGIDWAEQAIISAPASIDHVFVSVHPPAFPRDRHMGESLDENRATRDAFWRMLVRHKDRVHAMFHGHTHFYCRLRVNDPASAAANDPAQFPNDPDGVWHIGDGSAGRGERNTVVFVLVNGKTLQFRTVAAKHGLGEPFKVIDSWSY